MNFPLITDWYFYAVAVPAVLLLGISKSGFGAGFGSLAVPLMAMAVSVPQAAAILMPVLLVMDLLGIAALRKEFDKRLLKFLLPFGLLGTVIGALLFKVLAANIVAGIVGGFTLLFLAQRLLFPPRADSAPPPRWLGAILTATSGFTSFVAHAGGPPIDQVRRAVPTQRRAGLPVREQEPERGSGAGGRDRCARGGGQDEDGLILGAWAVTNRCPATPRTTRARPAQG